MKSIKKISSLEQVISNIKAIHKNQPNRIAHRGWSLSDHISCVIKLMLKLILKFIKFKMRKELWINV